MPDESFVGSRLQVAREFRGLTQRELARNVSASSTLISLLEAGKKKPSNELVEAFCDLLHFRPEFFHMRFAEVFRDQECSFRHRRAAPERVKTRVRAQATLIGTVIDKLETVFNFPSPNLPKFNVNGGEEIELAAENTRRFWGLDIDAPIHHLARVLEHAGIIIVQNLVQSKEIDAFSRSGKHCVMFLNRLIPSPSRWNFDMAHECGHLVIHNGVVTGSKETEAAADKFASAFLMPRNAFSREFRARSFSWEHIFKLKRRWLTSAAAIVRRAYDLDLIGAHEYRQSYKYMAWKAWSSDGEPYEPDFQEPELLPGMLTALSSEVGITLLELSKDLGFTPGTFEELTGVAVPMPNRSPVIALNRG